MLHWGVKRNKKKYQEYDLKFFFARKKNHLKLIKIYDQ